jgi:hypothetical protein
MSTAGKSPSSRLHPEKLDARLFLAAVAVCAVTRPVALEGFPIYFFTDEAANTVMAAEFVQNGLRDSSGELFPTYFANSEKLSLSLSVYAQVIPAWLNGTDVLRRFFAPDEPESSPRSRSRRPCGCASGEAPAYPSGWSRIQSRVHSTPGGRQLCPHASCSILRS